jgi:hypothetical protein
MPMTRYLMGTLPLVALMAPDVAAAQDYVQVALGADYSSGDYGETEDTDFLSVPLTVKAKQGDLTVSVSLPYLDVTGPANVVPGDGGVPGSNDTTVSSRSGLGDVIANATYTFAIAESTWFDTTAKVKFPTASSSKSLGTGTTDFTLQGELLHSFGPVSAAVRGGRRFNGSSADFPLQDVWLAGAGLYLNAGDTTLGLDYDWRDGSLPTSPDRSEITGSLTQKLSDRLRLQGYVYSGMADGSPDLGGGAQILYRFGL